MIEQMHGMMEIPAGKKIGDMLPAYAAVKSEFGPIGTPCKVCASCKKPFTVSRKPRIALRLYPVHLSIPISFLYRLCGRCKRLYQSGGAPRESVLASIQKFLIGKE